METFICQACSETITVGPTARDQERLHRKVCGACEDGRMTGLPPLDHVLGGGLVAASVVLRAGATSVQLHVSGSLDGEMNIVYPRKDAPLFHVIAKAPPGAAFTVGEHFDVCSVCKEHGVTFEQFRVFMMKDHS